MTTAAVYLRISKDKALGTEDEGLGVERQLAAVKKALAAKNWTVGTVYTDNDVSASGKVKRPAYEQMLADYAAGEFDAIAAYDHDRLTRRPIELERLIELNAKQGLLVTTASGDVDFTSPNGILFARFRVNLAADELLRRSTRQKAKFSQAREAGRPHWGGKRPFGLTLEGKEVPAEAQAIRDIAESIIDGGTIASGVELLNSRGLPTTFGKPWQRQPLRRTLLNPRLAGLREHNGELIKGNWDAVLDKETWEAVVNTLNTPDRAFVKRTDREYTLTGLLLCGVCGAKCYGQIRKGKGNRKATWVYRCSVNSSHVSKSVTNVDRLVMLQTVMALQQLDYEEVETDRKALKALREAKAKEVKDWSDWMQEAADEGLRPSEIRPARERHEARVADLNRQIAEMEKVSLVRLPTPEEEDEGILKVFEWEGLSLEKRRRLVETVWESITLKPSGKGARWSNDNVVFVPHKL